MAANYVLLERITVGAAGAASVTFQNIPQTGYTDLKIVASYYTSSNNNLYIKFNGSTTSYTNKVLSGSGSAVSSYSNITGSGGFAGDTPVSGVAPANVEIYIPNYTSSNYKSYSIDSVTEANATTTYMDMTAGLWSNTSAITTIGLFAAGLNFNQYSTFSLYGLAAVGATPAIDPKATGGDIIQTDGTYWYHAFLSSGTFTPKVGLTCDVLVVAGGGGTTNGNGSGGGGGGGLVYSAAQTLANGTTYTCTVGAGGAGYSGAFQSGLGKTSGSNSNMTGGSLSLTAAVGGGYGNDNGAGANGGSGGGAGSNTTASGGTGTSGQGTSGGSATRTTANSSGGGGGGGATVAGTNAVNGIPGAGGNGSSAYSSWGAATGTGQNVSGTYYYAGGGGGGWDYRDGSYSANAVGGYGGGGAGANRTATNGTANTGGGGGGTGYDGSVSGTYSSGAGGSGIVIVRYTVA